ncbi:unnamed protein product, partial [marine sediment metagenome]
MQGRNDGTIRQSFQIGDGASGDVTLAFNGDAGNDGSIVYDVSDDEFDFDRQINMNTKKIINLLDPVDDQDSATKKFHNDNKTVAGDLLHNSLGGIDDGDINHLTDAQVAALHAIVTAVYNLRCLDDRDFKPNTADTYGFVKAYFTSLGGMTGVADSDYQDLIILNTYTDGTGGDINALTFDKSEMLIKHWLADQTAGTWGTPKTLQYLEDKYTNAEAVQAVEDAGLVMENPIDMKENLLTLGNSGVADPIELLKFEIERAWSFRKRSTGASTYLALEADVNGKVF